MKRFFFDCGTRDAVASSGLFVLRLGIGLMMLIGHGLPKLQKFNELKSVFPTPDFFPLNWMNSTVSLSATIAAEVLAPILLILGFMTRPAAFLLAFTMVVAVFHIHQSDPWFLGPGVIQAKELGLLYLIPMLVLIISGAGAWSADAALYEEKRRRRW
jgi:putative oxidoreductase